MSESTSDNKIQSLEEQRLVAAAAKLSAVHEPQRDLWPEIEQHIQVQPNTRPMPSWMPFALAASLIMTVVSLGFSSYLFFNQTESPAAASNSIARNVIDTIDQPYILARASYLEELVVGGESLDPEVREVLKENLDIIDQATAEIRKALNENPNDALLIDALIQTREKEMALFRKLTTSHMTTI